MDDDPILDALEGKIEVDPELDSDRDSLKRALRWCRDNEQEELAEGWLDVIEKRRLRQDGTHYGAEIIAMRMTATLRAVDFDGRPISTAAVRRWRLARGI